MKNTATQPTAKSHWPTIVVWATAALNLLTGGLAAGALVLIPASLDPVETISAGVAPWLDAGYAAAAFLGLLVSTAIALRLWHSQRFRLIGGALTMALALGGAFAYAGFYAEYF